MYKTHGLILVVSLLLAFCPDAPAGDLPTLSQTSSVQTGRFPSGLSYYIVPNTSSKGYANFALVQKGVGNRDDARAALESSFFPSKGVGYTRDGYISWHGTSAVFRFEDVPVFQSVASDSTIVSIFNLVGSCKGEQAIIVSGDVDAARLRDRLYMMSLMMQTRTPVEDPPYEWKAVRGVRVLGYPSDCNTLALIKFCYRAPRTPRRCMNTPQPLVTEMYSREMGYIVRKRLEGLFAEKDVPLAFAGFRYYDSSVSSGDERYVLTVGVSQQDVPVATTLVSGVLADMDANGVSMEEFRDAKASFQARLQQDASRTISNREYVNACVSNYLYGSQMASNDAVYGFFRGRRISPDRDLSLFNSFVSALLDRENNLTLEYATPSDSVDADALKSVFRGAWKAPSAAGSYHVGYSDTLSLYYPVSKKVKLRSEVDEPLTGGKVWTFSNGIKVVFRKTDNPMLRYAFMIRGGFTGIPGISGGESAFAGDMLGLCNISGMDPIRFRNMLESNGINMNYSVGFSDLRIFGSVPSAKLGLLMRTILSIQKNRTPDPFAFDYYKHSEALRQEAFRVSSKGVFAAIDSIMCPDYLYPETKTVSRLTSSLPLGMEYYLDAQFAKNNDGVIFIEGKMDPYELQKLLGRTLGGLRTGKNFSVRPKVDFVLRSGWSTYSVERGIGDGRSATVAMSAERPFTMQSWFAFRIAVEALRTRLVKDMASMGQYVQVVPRLQLLPSERITVFICCRPCPSDGLPADVEPEDPLTTLGALRDCIAALRSRPVSAVELKGLKDALSNELASETADPDYMMDAFLRRYSEGKDMVSNWQAYLSKVTVGDVADVFSALEKGAKVEFVVK